MNETEKLLNVAMEESAEVIQACSKSIRFGLGNHHPNRNNTNADEILIEFYQLEAIIEKLQRAEKLPKYSEEYIKNIKKNKLAKMKKYETQTKNNKRNNYK